jgi:hypothetical protein
VKNGHGSVVKAKSDFFMILKCKEVSSGEVTGVSKYCCFDATTLYKIRYCKMFV